MSYYYNIPQIPSEQRSQFYFLNRDGSYKYGYNSGSGSFAKQSGDSNNQVVGEYGFKDTSGNQIDLKYTSGVQGYVPVSANYESGNLIFFSLS